MHVRTDSGRGVRPLRYAHVDDPVGTHVPQDDVRAPGEGDDEPWHRCPHAEAEVDARILRRQVAAPRLHLARRAARSHDRARHEARESHVQPMADRAGRPQQQQLPADRIHCDRHPAVVADVGGGDTAPIADEARGGKGADGRPVRAGLRAREHAHGLCVAAEVRHRDRPCGQHELRAAGVREVDPRGAPAGEPGAEPAVELGARVHEATGAETVGGRGLAARVRHEQAPVRRCDAHAREQVGDALGLAAFLEAEAEPGGVGRRAAGPRHVHVEVVGVLVVRHVEVGATVAVDVREERPEAVPGGRRLQAGLHARLTEAAAALVQEQPVADPREVRREAGVRPRRRCVRVGVAGGEEIGASVAVHVADRSAGVPARPGKVLALEGAAPVPEYGDAVRRGDDEVCPAVAVQVAGRAAVALQREACVRLLRNVREPAVDVSEELARREPALRLPALGVGARVRVDGEQVDPSVIVVVEEADAAAHHRLRLGGHAEAERALAEVDPDRRRDVLQLVRRLVGARFCGRLGGDALRRRERQPPPAVGVSEYVRPASWATADGGPWSVPATRCTRTVSPARAGTAATR